MHNELPGDRDARKVIFQIKRALCGHITFLAACRMEKAFSEYVLYESILRVLLAYDYQVECEYAHPCLPKRKKGDYKKIDFYATGTGPSVVIEVKWARNPKIMDIKRDAEKLRKIKSVDSNCIPLLCIFGRKKFIARKRLKLKPDCFKEWGRPVYVDRAPMYGCRFFELKMAKL
jgi:hypothetical protein